MRTALVSLACLALALSACKDEPKKATGGTAQGEILPGSTSDAMLPLETVKSQAPLAPKVEGGEKGDAKAKATSSADDTAAEAAAAGAEAAKEVAQEPAAEEPKP